VSPRRIQRKRTKGWRMPSGAVYVGRPGRFGNPYVALVTLTDAVPAAESVAGFEDLWRRWLADPAPCYDHMRRALRGLAGKDLVCWCPLDQPCHADVLLRLANPDTELSDG